MPIRPLDVLEFFQIADAADAKRVLDIASTLVAGRGNGTHNTNQAAVSRPRPTTTTRTPLAPTGTIGSWTEQILRERGKQIHAKPLFETLRTRFGCESSYPTVISGLSRLVKKRDIFTRPEPNTFGLIEWEGKTNRG